MDWIQIRHTLWPWEANLILWLQDLPAEFITSMQWVSELGHPPFMLSLIILCYWGWKEEMGIQLAKFLTLSGVVMSLSKDLILAPRPFWIHADIETLGKAGGFGMPSGHAMMACVWLVVMAHTKSNALKTLGWSVILLTGLSRVTLGLHSPLQVAAGWAVGVLVFGEIVFKLFNSKSTLSPHTQDLKRNAILIGILILGAFMIYSQNHDWQAPKAWSAFLEEKGLSTTTIRTPTPKGFVIYLSIFTSLVIWNWIRAVFMPKLQLQGTFKQRLGRVTMGILVGIASYYFYQAKKSSISNLDTGYYLMLISLCGVSSFLLVIGFPWFFQKIRLDSECKSQSMVKNCSSSSRVL